MIRHWIRAIAIVTMLSASLAVVKGQAWAAPLRANNGTILYLTAVGSASPGDPIQINSSVRADSDIQKSNLYYELYEPGGSLVDTHTVAADRLDPGDVVNEGWSSNNTPNTGTYTVTLCWSTGNATNCDIAYAETSFYSVPTMGIPLSLLGLALLGFLLWSRNGSLKRLEL
jgi:hypothetical protein